VTADGSGLSRIWDYVNDLKTSDVVVVKILRAGEVAELKTQMPAR
jgi:hypothetical protein